MLYYRFAELDTLVSGMDDAAFFRARLSEYERAAFQNNDLFISHSEPLTIEKPRGDVLCQIGIRTYLQTPDGGFGIYDMLPDSCEVIALVLSDKNWSRVETQLKDITSIGGSPNDLRCFNMMGDLMRFVLLKQSGLILHASAISYRGQGIAFSAPSGTGKSTHTKLWQECLPDVEIINDDAPAIRFTQDKTTISGLPWSGTSGINSNVTVPLRAIVILEQDENNSIRRMSSIEALYRILNETKKPLFPDLTSALMEHVRTLLLRVPIYLLKCNISRDAVETVYREVFGE